MTNNTLVPGSDFDEVSNQSNPAEADSFPAPEIELRMDLRPSLAELKELYESVGWSAYTSQPKVLEKAVAGSLRVVTAWHDGTLVGLARVVGDGASIAYLQDVLVRPDYRRHGIGRRLVIEVFAPYADVRQHVLLTDEGPGTEAFYESLGFIPASETKPSPARAYVRFSSGGRRTRA